MLTDEAKQELVKQQYRIIGSHSAVKICGWTKKHIRGEGACYKNKFYGINSSQCMQMTSSLSCANRCVYCWRGYKAPVSTEWPWPVDDPKFIVDNALKSHYGLLTGFGGSAKADKSVFLKSHEVRHVALSLTGESICYPRINELIDEFHKRKISTFLVTNAQYPELIRDLRPVTQLYLSMDSPTEEMMKGIGVPLFADYWARFNRSLEFLSGRKERTCIRLTCIKGINMVMPGKYVELIRKGDPDFVEVKAYMFLGSSRQRLKFENMPDHKDIVEFAAELSKFLPAYDIVDEHTDSRVVLLAKKGVKVRIDFDSENFRK